MHPKLLKEFNGTEILTDSSTNTSAKFYLLSLLHISTKHYQYQGFERLFELIIVHNNRKWMATTLENNAVEE